MAISVRSNITPQEAVDALEMELRKNLKVNIECKDSVCALVNIILTLNPEVTSTLPEDSFPVSRYTKGPALELTEQIKTIPDQDFFKVALAAIAKTFKRNLARDNPLSLNAIIEDGTKCLKKESNNDLVDCFVSEKLKKIARIVF